MLGPLPPRSSHLCCCNLHAAPRTRGPLVDLCPGPAAPHFGCGCSRPAAHCPHSSCGCGCGCGCSCGCRCGSRRRRRRRRDLRGSTSGCLCQLCPLALRITTAGHVWLRLPAAPTHRPSARPTPRPRTAAAAAAATAAAAAGEVHTRTVQSALSMFPPLVTEAALVVVTVVVARRLAPRLARARAPASLARLAALRRCRRRPYYLLTTGLRVSRMTLGGCLPPLYCRSAAATVSRPADLLCRTSAAQLAPEAWWTPRRCPAEAR